MANQRFESTPIFKVDGDPVIIQAAEGSTTELLSLKSHDGSVVASIGPSGAIESTSPSSFQQLTVTSVASLPSTTSIGSVSHTEISHLNGVTSGVQSQIDSKAPLASPAFTGTPTAPTPITGTNTTQIATTEFVRAEVANLIASAPTTLDTLDELATALGDDPNFATTVTNSIATRAPLNSPALTGIPTAPTASAGTNTTQIATTAFAQELVDSFLPSGMISPYAGSAAPSGWLLCAGQTVSRTTYSRLFSAIGTTYNTGGEAVTDFRLPDLRGRVIAGVDNMGGTPASRLTSTTINGGAETVGKAGGSQTHLLTGAQSGTSAHGHTASSGNDSPDHSHQQIIGWTGSGNVLPYWDGNTSRGQYGAGNTGGASARHTHSITVNQSSAANALEAHNNVQPTIVLNYIIKV